MPIPGGPPGASRAVTPPPDDLGHPVQATRPVHRGGSVPEPRSAALSGEPEQHTAERRGDCGVADADLIEADQP